jgi:phosphoribosylformylglycinamidine cyclo-ligase
VDEQQEGAQRYREAGVDYAVLDRGKRHAVLRALETSGALESRGGRVDEASRGESAFVFQTPGGQTMAQVLEGLGTKSIIARRVAEELAVNRFRDVAYDTVCAILNDLCCVGARPLVVNAYFSTGKPDWFSNADWYEELVDGWHDACLDAGCTWGGGESPSLPELVQEEEIELAGAAIGEIPAGREPILGQELDASDEIVLLASTGIHANGASLARVIAGELPERYATRLPNGATFGEALLRPSYMYSSLVESILDAGVPVRYMSHLTGHGFLKLMRARRELRYRIRRLLPVPEVLEFLVEKAGMSPRVAYSTFNMGHGFAIYCAAGSGERVVEVAGGKGIAAIVAGSVESGPRSVMLEPLGNLEFAGEEMQLGPQVSSA